VLRLLERGRQ